VVGDRSRFGPFCGSVVGGAAEAALYFEGSCYQHSDKDPLARGQYLGYRAPTRVRRYPMDGRRAH
jgi:hypothetical protein